MAYRVQYYDLVLIAIVVALGFGGFVGVATPVSMPVALVVLGGVAIAVMGHAMFVNGPVDEFDDLTEPVEVEDAPVAASDLPLLD